MSKLYDDVKKQGEQIDDLQKKVTDHDTRIETLETQAMATPTNSDAPIPNVTVSIPDNIATTENISDLVDDAIERNTDVMTNAITKLYTNVLPKQAVSETLPATISDEQIRKIAQEAADKASEKAMNIRYDKLDAAADTVMHRLYNLVNGAIWAAIPMGICCFCNRSSRRRRLRIWLLLSAQRKLQTERCRMALPLRARTQPRPECSNAP